MPWRTPAIRGPRVQRPPYAGQARTRGRRGSRAPLRSRVDPRQLPGAGEQSAVLAGGGRGARRPLPRRRPPGAGAAPPRASTFGTGIALGVPLARRAAAGTQGAEEALGAARRAEGRPELHQRLVAVARAARDRAARPRRRGAGGARRSPAGPRPGRDSAREPARRCRPSPARRPRRRCSPPPPPCTRRRREAPADPSTVDGNLRRLGDLAGRGVELARPPVVAEPGPEGEHLLDLGPRPDHRRWEIFPGSACKKGAPSPPGSAEASPRRARSL